jgi:predicted NBD/HSP70 family sugar kinase
LKQATSHYVGIDVLRKRTFISVISEQGKTTREAFEKTDPHLIGDYLEKPGLEEMIVDFESSSLTPYLLRSFKERAIDPI